MRINVEFIDKEFDRAISETCNRNEYSSIGSPYSLAAKPLHLKWISLPPKHVLKSRPLSRHNTCEMRRPGNEVKKLFRTVRKKRLPPPCGKQVIINTEQKLKKANSGQNEKLI